ncbi:Ral GTPase-activating protein subunit alpha/beta N-terminal domain-containing protein [Entamoeba marina]
MLSSTIKSTDLLSQPLNTDILKFLPIDVQQLVVRAISNNIIAHQRDVVENFPTDDHVKWVMEVIGTGFSLPFIDIDTISDCLTIYENWFDENEIPPTPIGEKREEYVNVAIGQLSLLFVRRDKQGVSAQIMIKYSDLCNRAFAFLMRLSELNYSTNTLRRIVCVVMAAVDDLCVIEHGIGNFYQLWGILSTQEKDMWDVLMSMHKKWVQVYEVASSWARMVNALQNTLMKCMFVEKTEEFNFQIHSNKTTITTTFNKKYGLYYYIKMVHMCGNPSNIIDSKVSAVVQQGFYDLIGMMIGIM